MNHDRRTYKIPPEITDDIISCLHADRKSLSACALVHRTWTTRSQSLIFRRMRITGVNGEIFLEFLKKNPHIAQYVVILVIEEDKNSRIEGPEFLPNIIGLLSALNELVIRHPRGGWPKTSKSMTDMPLPASSSFPVRKLQLRVEFLSGREMAQFLARFPLLEELDLYISFLWFGDVQRLINPEIELPPLPQPPARLARLNIGDADLDGQVYDWLTSAPSSSLGSIKSLRLGEDPMRVPAIPNVNSLLEALGSTLQHLELEFPKCLLPDGTADMISIVHNTGLRSLTLEMHISSMMQSPVWVPAVLTQISSPDFETLNLRFRYESHSARLAGIGLERIDQIMTDGKFTKLVKVFIDAGHSNEEISEVRSRMGRLNARNILRLAYESGE